jgi:hypothetical protein
MIDSGFITPSHDRITVTQSDLILILVMNWIGVAILIVQPGLILDSIWVMQAILILDLEPIRFLNASPIFRLVG